MATMPTLEEVLEYLEYAGLGLTEDHLPSVLTKLVTARISGFVEEHDVTFDSLADLDDSKFYLWGAGMALYLEMIAQRGQIHWNTGDVSEQQVGDVTTKYQRWSPMFFFAQGHAPNFYALLPHDSYRMMAYELVRKWFRHYFKKERPTEVMFGTRSAYFDPSANMWLIRSPGGDLSWVS
jgi:hypothetical protein